ncbi:MAG: ABC transporter permease [Betaproteobacteria bacterium]
MLSKALIIARFTLLEAVRTRLLWQVLILFGALYSGGLFVQHISVTESARMQTGFLAATIRFAAVIVLSLHIASSMAREFNDKGVDLLLSLDLPRAVYYVGKFIGFAGIGIGIALAGSLALLSAAPVVGLAWWGISLAFELVLIAALALFCVMTFAQIMPAVSFVLAFYLLARSMSAVRLLSVSPLLSQSDMSNRAIAQAVDALAWSLPNLDQFTATTWLVDGSTPSALATVAAQTCIYAGLLLVAGLFDLYRKNL